MAQTAFEWDAAKRDRFAAEINKHTRAGMSRDGVFEFEGGKFMLGYAKMLCEYLYTVLQPPRSKVSDVVTKAKPKRKVAGKR